MKTTKANSIPIPLSPICPGVSPTTTYTNIRPTDTPFGTGFTTAQIFDRTTLRGQLLASGIFPDGIRADLRFQPAPEQHAWTITVLEDDICPLQTTIQAQPYCALFLDSGFLLMTDQGPIRIIRHNLDHWSIDVIFRQAPSIPVSAVDAGTLSATVGPLTFTNVNFSRTSPTISNSDLRTLSASLSEAYSRIAAAAAGARLWFQPLLIRCHLLSSDGRRIFSTPIRLITPQGGWQCSQALDATTSRSGTTLEVDPIQLQASAFTISVDLSSVAASIPHAAAVEVCVLPQLHPHDQSLQAPYRIVRPSLPNPSFSTALPGATSGFASLHTTRAETLSQIISRADILETQIAYIPIDQAHTSRPVNISAPAAASPETDKKALDAALSQKISFTGLSAKNSLLADIASSSRFCARRVAVSGNSILWADITPIISAGYAAADTLTPGSSTSSWTGILSITLRGGRTITEPIGASSAPPRRWAPLVCYPNPEAIMAQVWIKLPDGTMFHSSTPLTPAADGSCAYSLDPDLQGSEFQPFTGSMPQADTRIVAGTRHPGAVILSPLASPLAVDDAAISCSSPILFLSPTCRHPSIWGNRPDFYAISSQGIFGIAGHPPYLSASIIDPGGIQKPEAAVFTSSGVMALSNNRLVRIAGKRVDILLLNCQATDIGWHSSSGIMILRNPDGTATATDPQACNFRTIHSPVSIQRLIQVGSHLEALADSFAVVSLQSPQLTPIEFRTHIEIPWPRRIKTLTLIAAASRFRGTLTLSAADPLHLPSAASPIALARPSQSATDSSDSTHTTGIDLCTIDIDGPISAPLTVNLLIPHRRFIALTLKGHASHDMLIHSASLTLSP